MTRRRTLEFLAGLAVGLLSALALAACGRKGDLEPPPGRQLDQEETKKPAGS